MYDWANSVFPLVITTAIFPPYFLKMTTGKIPGADESLTRFFGLEVTNSVLYTYCISFAFVLVALLNPYLSALADFSGKKKAFMQFFCYLGGISSSLLFFFYGKTVEYGTTLFIMAMVGFAGSLVFYNSFLPEIATEDRFDKVSAKGFSLGYFGSVLLLIANLVMILKGEAWFGITDGTLAPRLAFLTVGLWWIGFAQITFAKLEDKPTGHKMEGMLTKGFDELKKVWYQLQELKLTKRFLLAFFFYSMGVQAVMYLATVFGETVVGMEQHELIILVLLLQLIAIPGAYLFAKISEWKGNIVSLISTMVIWIGVCLYASTLASGMKYEFYGVAVFVGMVMGGVQSMSRSTYSKFIPSETEDTASFFSFYEFLEKVSIALGTFIFGLVFQVTGDMNKSAVALSVFFVLGLLLLLRIPSRHIYDVHLKGEK